jgi:hypothetical protein
MVKDAFVLPVVHYPRGSGPKPFHHALDVVYGASGTAKTVLTLVH